MNERRDVDNSIKRAAVALKAMGAREIYLFGSSAHGHEHDGSDIDMAVTGLPPERFFAAMGEAGRCLDRNLDLVDLDEPSPFTQYLRDEGELVRVD